MLNISMEVLIKCYMFYKVIKQWIQNTAFLLLPLFSTEIICCHTSGPSQISSPKAIPCSLLCGSTCLLAVPRILKHISSSGAVPLWFPLAKTLFFLPYYLVLEPTMLMNPLLQDPFPSLFFSRTFTTMWHSVWFLFVSFH